MYRWGPCQSRAAQGPQAECRPRLSPAWPPGGSPPTDRLPHPQGLALELLRGAAPASAHLDVRRPGHDRPPLRPLPGPVRGLQLRAGLCHHGRPLLPAPRGGLGFSGAPATPACNPMLVPCHSPWRRWEQLGRIEALSRLPSGQLLVWKLIAWAAVAPLGLLLPTPLGWIHRFPFMPTWVPGVEGTACRSQGALWWPQAQQAPAVPRSRTW